jgi:hypothetical protein
MGDSPHIPENVTSSFEADVVRRTLSVDPFSPTIAGAWRALCRFGFHGARIRAGPDLAARADNDSIIETSPRSTHRRERTLDEREAARFRPNASASGKRPDDLTAVDRGA